MPAEWEPHRATWIAWPHLDSDFPGKLKTIDWVYTEIVRLLSQSELVEIVVTSPQQRDHVQNLLNLSWVKTPYRLHVHPTDRSWLRDSGPTGIITTDSKGGSVKHEWLQWKFNAWARYDDCSNDQKMSDIFSQISERPIIPVLNLKDRSQVVLEGGAIEVDGAGTLLTTEQCLLSPLQARNTNLDRDDYEEVFRNYLGIKKTIWLDRSFEGDDTHGHIDNVARFTPNGVVALAFQEDPNDLMAHEASIENYRRLEKSSDANGRRIEVVKLPMPDPIYYGDDGRLPASYANFYIANKVVLVPTFNDKNDRKALNILSELFKDREVIGIHSVDLILGQGSLHCLTQQEPQ
jgi:agmatine deiminase